VEPAKTAAILGLGLVKVEPEQKETLSAEAVTALNQPGKYYLLNQKAGTYNKVSAFLNYKT